MLSKKEKVNLFPNFERQSLECIFPPEMSSAIQGSKHWTDFTPSLRRCCTRFSTLRWAWRQRVLWKVHVGGWYQLAFQPISINVHLELQVAIPPASGSHSRGACFWACPCSQGSNMKEKIVLTLVKTVGETLFRTVVRGTKVLTVGRETRIYSRWNKDKWDLQPMSRVRGSRGWNIRHQR